MAFMLCYRIVKSKARANDLSGAGAFRTGGRWNSKGTYMLYTSENRSLAYLENLVHLNVAVYPPDLYIIELEVDDSEPLFILPEKDYPCDWMKLELLENKALGDRWITERKFLGIKVRSAINGFEYNYLLNPLFPKYYDLVKVKSITEIPLDPRLVG